MTFSYRPTAFIAGSTLLLALLNSGCATTKQQPAFKLSFLPSLRSRLNQPLKHPLQSPSTFIPASLPI